MTNTQDSDTSNAPNEEPGGRAEEVDSRRPKIESLPNESVIEIRSKIHALLDLFAEEGLATEGTVGEYREAAESDKDVDGLTGFFHWIVEKRFMAIRCLKEVETEIDAAIEDQVISGEDREALMGRMVLNGEVDFVGQVDAIQEAVHQALEEMVAAREEFDALAENPLVEEGVLAIGEDEEIEIPGLEGYLEMSMEERLAFLSTVRAALPKAEEHKGFEECRESIRLDGEFHELLTEARKEGVVGFRVIQRFKGMFRKLENEEKAEAIEAIEEILEPYVELWEEIGETFEGGRPLARLQGLRDLLDHRELRDQFERTVRQECVRMDWEYDRAIDLAHAKRILPSKERREWKAEMHAEDLEGKRECLEGMEENLEPYAELRDEISELEDAEQIRELNSMYWGGSFGLEEIQTRFGELVEEGAGEEEGGEEVDEKSLRLLSSLDSEPVVDAILAASEELDYTQKKQLVGRLDHYLQGKVDRDYRDYDDNVKEARVEHKVAFIEHSNLLDEKEEERLFSEEELLEEESDEIVLPLDTEEGVEEEVAGHEHAVKVIEIPEPEAETNEDETFEETVYLDKEDEEEDTRVVRMYINDSAAVKSFNSNALLNEENDKLSLVTGGEDEDCDEEFNLQETRVLVDFLKNDLRKEEQAMRVAA